MRIEQSYFNKSSILFAY